MFIILGEVSLRAKRDAGLGEELDMGSLVLLSLTSVNIRRSPLEPELLQSDNRLIDRAELHSRFGTSAVSTEHIQLSLKYYSNAATVQDHTLLLFCTLVILYLTISVLFLVILI